MRNLKKFLALVLAMMMVMSLMITVNAANKTLDDYVDGDQVTGRYQTAVDFVSQLGILEGTGGSTFNPKGNLTRAQVATIAYRITTGDVDDDQVDVWSIYDWFNDLDEAPWAQAYINFAANSQFVFGRGNSTYDPNADVTGYEMLAVMLRTLGWGRNGEYQGADWDKDVFYHAVREGLVQGIPGTVDLGKVISREVVAQIVYNTIQAELVEWDGLTYNRTGKPMIGWTGDTYPDVWGVPYTEYYCVWNTVKTTPAPDGWVTITYDPYDVFYTVKSECDIFDDAVKNGASLREVTYPIVSAFIDGVELDLEDDTDLAALATDGKAELDPFDYTEYLGGNGRETKVYVVNGKVWISEKNVYLAKVDSIDTFTADPNGHKHPDQANLIVYLANDAENGYFTVTGKVDVEGGSSLDIGDWVLVRMYLGGRTPTVADYDEPEKLGTGKLTDYTVTSKQGGLNTSEDPVTEFVDAAHVRANGIVNDTTITAIEDSTYLDSDKFVVIETGEDDTTSAENTNKYYSKTQAESTGRTLAALGDGHGNVIGLVKSASGQQLMTITWIEWKQYNDQRGGRALFEGVTSAGDPIGGEVSYIGAYNADPSLTLNVATNKKDQPGNIFEGTVSDYWENNGGTAYDDQRGTAIGTPTGATHTNDYGYYGHIFTYYELADGTYTIVLHDEVDVTDSSTTVIHDAKLVSSLDQDGKADGSQSNMDYQILKGSHYITDEGINTYAINDATTFVFYDPDTYEAQFVPSRNDDWLDNLLSTGNNAADLCVYYEDGYATFVVVYGYALKPTVTPATGFEGYITTATGTPVTINGTNLMRYTLFNYLTGAQQYVYAASGVTSLPTGYYRNASYNGSTNLLAATDLVLEGLKGDRASIPSTKTGSTVKETYGQPNYKTVGGLAWSADLVVLTENAVEQAAVAKGWTKVETATGNVGARGYSVTADDNEPFAFNIYSNTPLYLIQRTKANALRNTTNDYSLTKIDGIYQSYLTKDSVIMVVYSTRTVGNNTYHDAQAVYIYQGTAETVDSGNGGGSSAKTLSITTNENTISDADGVYPIASTTTSYTFEFSVTHGDWFDVQAYGCTATYKRIDTVNGKDVYRVTVEDFTEISRVNVVSYATEPTKAGNSDFTSSNTDVEHDNVLMKNLYTKLGLTVTAGGDGSDDYQNLKIKVNETTFTSEDADEQAKLAMNNGDGTNPPSAGDWGFVAIGLGEDGHTLLDFTVNGKNHGTQTGMEWVYLRIAKWNGTSMDLVEDGTVYTVSFIDEDDSSKLYTYTITVVYEE